MGDWILEILKFLEIWILEMFGNSDIGDIRRFVYWRYLEIWILEIRYSRLDIGVWDFGDRTFFCMRHCDTQLPKSKTTKKSS